MKITAIQIDEDTSISIDADNDLMLDGVDCIITDVTADKLDALAKALLLLKASMEDEL